ARARYSPIPSMLQALLVTFREGLESFLIVGVIAAYLRKTGRSGLMPGVRAGLGLSVITCLAGAYLWQMVPNQPLYEGIAALSAAALVGAFLIQMLRMGRHMKGQIEARVARVAGPAAASGAGLSDLAAQAADLAAQAAARPPAAGTAATASWAALAGIAGVTALLVTREGLEALLYLGIQVRMSGSGWTSLIGGGVGLVLAVAVAWIWSHYAHRLNLGVVLKVTAVFLALFLLQLLVYGVHELAESGVIEGTQHLHDLTELFGPQGAIGHVMSYALLAAPLLYLLWSRRAPSPARTSPPPRPSGV
ncbi:MAG: FTR1 family protein, partial [Polyangia bacterium]